MIKGILFDVDGVLIDVKDNLFQAINATLPEYGKEKLTKKEFDDYFWGVHIEEFARNILPSIPEEKLREFLDNYHEKRIKYTDYAKVYPDTIKILDEIIEKEYKMAAITSTIRSVTLKTLEKFDLRKYFPVVICGEDAKPKPDPEPVFKACEGLGISTREAVVVGDNPQDIVSGKSAGALTVGITTSRTENELKGADLIIKRLSELSKRLNL